MGKNKLAKFAEMARFENVLQVSYRELAEEGFSLKGKWASRFFHNQAPLVLELGCGKGEYTVELAERFPDKNYIGVDIKGARMFTGAKRAIEKELKNVAFLRTRIENIGQFFDSSEVEAIWLTFPDPQMKNARKRLTSTFFLKRYLPFLDPSGVVHLKTDSNFQYQYTLAVAQHNRFEILAQTDNLYQSDLLNDILRVRTFYEKQWIDRGIDIKYLAFRLSGNPENWEEPAGEIEKDSYRSFGRSARE